MAGSPNASQSHAYATVVGFGPSPRPSSAPVASIPAAPPTLDPLGEPNWLQEEMKRMEAYTFAQLAKLEEQRKILLNHQSEVERDLVLKKQQLNQQTCLISSRVAALQQREQALTEREAALNAESERLRKVQQELLVLVQSRVQTPESATAVQAEPAPPEIEPVHGAQSKDNPVQPPAESTQELSTPAATPVEPTKPAAVEKSAPKKVSDAADRTSAHPGAARKKPAAALRSGNPVSVSVFPADDDAEPSPGWVIARSATELRLLADEAMDVGTVLRVRPTKAPIAFSGVSVEVMHCRPERNQWVLDCQMTRKLSGAFLQLFG